MAKSSYKNREKHKRNALIFNNIEKVQENNSYTFQQTSDYQELTKSSRYHFQKLLGMFRRLFFNLNPQTTFMRIHII